MTYLARIADLVLNQPLLLTPDKAEVIAAVLSGRIGLDAPSVSRFEGSPVTVDEQGRVKQRPFNVTADGIAVITITGSLVNRGAWVGASSGLTSYEGIQYQLKQADMASEVRAIVLDLHSPGGEAIGAFETAAMVRDIATRKTVVAVVNGMAASGGYAIASGATDIVTTSSGVSGSIGVISLHIDASGQLEQDGLKPTLIIAGSHKADGNPFGPLPDDVRASFQARVDGIYADFLSTVAAGRGDRLTVDMARATEARIYIGQQAVDAGLADRVGTFESVLADLTRAPQRNPSTKGKSPMETIETGAAPANLNAPTTVLPDTATQVQTALTAERVRMGALDSLASHIHGQADGLKIIADAKTSGASAGDTAIALITGGVFAKVAVLNGLQSDDKTAIDAAPAAPGSNQPLTATTPEGWKAEFAASTALQGEFASAEHYVAFKRADASGRVRVMGARKG
jgi:capsid assembly protease